MTQRSKLQGSKLTLISWAFYDWANSSFSAIIQTFVFAAYFTQHVAQNETDGTAEWGFANSLSALVIAVLAPICGAIADHGKKRKIWIFALTYLCIISTCLLWFVMPDPSYSKFALWTVSIGIIGAELSFVFYNATLADIAPAESLGKWSGWGWSMGYAGGVASLLTALFLFIDNQAFIASDKENAFQIRSIFPMVGIWYAFFSLPFFLFVPEKAGKGKSLKNAVKDGIAELKQTLKNLWSYKNIVKFLVARMFYIDGLTTLFAFGGVYAASLYGMNEKEILFFGITMNVSSGIGAAYLGSLDDRYGSKRIIILSLLGLLAFSSALLLVTSKSAFWTFGLLLGIFVGPVQSSSRAYMARVAPAKLRNEMFGFFALSGKATAFTGPFLVGLITYLTGSQRAGMSVILLLFLIGILCMLAVPKAAKTDSN